MILVINKITKGDEVETLYLSDKHSLDEIEWVSNYIQKNGMVDSEDNEYSYSGEDLCVIERMDEDLMDAEEVMMLNITVEEL